MTLGEKLARLRKEQNLTQEQLAEMLGVSRQAISKWESNAAYPETEKLIRLAKMYHCSLDYLLLDKTDQEEKKAPFQHAMTGFSGVRYERVSKRKIGNLPLWHINIGYGRTARGVFALGYTARGIVAVGVASAGVVSVGAVCAGLLSLGCSAAGLIAIGPVSAGVLALGAIAVGIFSMGSLAVGQFAVGAAALGRYAAFGDTALAAVAVGTSDAKGTLFQILLRDIDGQAFQTIWKLLEENVPGILKGFISWFLSFLQ